MITIESNVPMPVGAPNRKYPFDQMQVGDSFLVTNRDKKISVTSAVHTYSKGHPGLKFTVRTLDEGVRVWRIE